MPEPVRWIPGMPVATGVMAIRPEHLDAYHRQCQEAKDCALARQLSGMTKEQARTILDAVRDSRGPAARQRLIGMAVEIRQARDGGAAGETAPGLRPRP